MNVRPNKHKNKRCHGITGYKYKSIRPETYVQFAYSFVSRRNSSLSKWLK